ncbi:M36 family metallopeptidase [Paractinoplanes hotanensis]|uniref:M36 family metallopeptidase n=1 Tax=Paractinoplanes hotanensis TaxID=2906497 RepID=A0ABT0XST0_9ACTN|nr:M36 family metallopeptidase [Actinoplanes hotanensis]MCM4076217.1 M36 family metallopeptidase [Actinoplanes hotanensis]
MRTPPRALAGTAAGFLAAAIVLTASSGGNAAPAAPAQAPTQKVQGDDHHDHVVDNRQGRVAPTTGQRAAAVGTSARWNALGTPATLTATGAALETGLPAEPVAAARAYVDKNLDVLGLTARGAQALEHLTTSPIGEGAAVIFRQKFGDLVAGRDGLLSVGVRDGKVWFVSSSLARDAVAPEPATLTAEQAVASAAREAGVADPTVIANKLVAVPTPSEGARAAWQVTFGAELSGAEPVAYTSYVDARDGGILVREDIVDHDSDNPSWDVFPNSPPTDYSSRDTRRTWCWAPQRGCDEIVASSASPLAWDVDPATNEPTFTTRGNNAIAVENLNSNDAFSVGTETATPKPDRDYNYPWTNQWYRERCSPDVFTTPQRNDLDAARANLFGMHNRMHEWSYHLGFTEATWNMQDDNLRPGGLGDDYEQGNAQAGGISGGPPAFAARNNANQITPPDGEAPITNMYLWQPIAAAFYGACVDGDYDMSVIGHEYGHAITGRMIAGPDAGVSTPQGMSESWSDQLAVEYLAEHGYAPKGERGFTVGEYVTTDKVAGIRNYNMSNSPLNYSSVDYDFVGLQVHASGEVWSATNYDIRQAFIRKYGAGTPALNKSCANGKTPVTKCPGNRRWVQLVFDSFLLMANSQNSMVDARDAMLGADLVRFNGANQGLMWNAFAKRGLGEGAVSVGAGDANPTPSFASPNATEGTYKFRPVDEKGKPVAGAKLFVGDYQARAVPVADTDPATPLTDEVKLVPGAYGFIAQAPGHGHTRVGKTLVLPGLTLPLFVRMPANLASTSAGAVATGDGINLARITDDDEATNWASLGSAVAGKQVTVDLAGGAQTVRRVQVSAQLRPPVTGDPDAGTQNRYTALRQFKVLACTATATVTCSDAAEFKTVYTSKPDAFPSIAPRPRVKDLVVKSFDIRDTTATHLRLEVVTNQCTGAPDYAGEQDADPRANTDCATSSPQALNVRVAEFQAYAK